MAEEGSRESAGSIAAEPALPSSRAVSDPPAPSLAPRPTGGFFRWPWEKILIWSLFLFALYLLRHFFFVMLLTFLITSAMHRLTQRVTRFLSPAKDRRWLERAVATSLFALLVIAMGVGASVIGPRLLAQGQELIGRVSRIDPEREFRRLLTDTVGAYLFRLRFGDKTDVRYLDEFDKFEKEGLSGLAEFMEFPRLQDYLEGAFERKFEEEQTHHLLSDRRREGSLGPDFDAWFLKEKAPIILKGEEEGNSSADPSKVTPESSAKLLAEVKKVRPNLARYESEWHDLMVAKEVAALKQSAIYQKEFESWYNDRRKENPKGIPFDFPTYMSLREARKKGKEAFSKALAKPASPDELVRRARLHQDFQTLKRQELADHWWENSPSAMAVRSHVSRGMADWSSSAAGWIQSAVAYGVTIPVQLTTALLLSFFITVDFTNLRQGVQRLEESRLKGIYREIYPGVISFAQLIGRSFQAQGIVSLFNTSVLFLIFTMLGIDHALVLSAFIFVCCFIPVIGVIISGAPAVLIALLQPGGSIGLAANVVLAILLVHLFETMVIDPKVFGKMMHMHPVMILVVLAIAEHFFGMWGLILGVPVAVYLISVVMGENGAGSNSRSEALLKARSEETGGELVVEAKNSARGSH